MGVRALFRGILWLTIVLACTAAGQPQEHKGMPWNRHVVDNSSRGADGVRLMDVNGDGLADITTGWEEGGRIRVYLNPGPAQAKQRWPAVTVGRVSDPEDAVFADLDGDGSVDVVSSCEGKTKTMYVHWAPQDKAKYLDPDAWQTEPIPATGDQQMWMYCLPMQIDGRHGVDLVVGSKGGGAMVGWLEAPENPRDLAAWRLHRLRDAGWIMSLIATDMDGDGDDDILFSDRKGRASGIYWLELKDRANPARAEAWQSHTVGAVGSEVMFIACERPLVNNAPMLVAAVKPDVVQRFLAPPVHAGETWLSFHLPCDTQRFGTMKAVCAADMTGDGRPDTVITCEGAQGDKSGVYLVVASARPDGPPRYIDVGGPEGVKYDRIELIDLDGDADWDILTCEEADNLGVIWYENPLR